MSDELWAEVRALMPRAKQDLAELVTFRSVANPEVQPSLGEENWQVPVWELTKKDGRWYGRGTADCKGNIVMQLTALRALKKVHGSLPCTVKIISEGSEEQGTGGLEAFVPENAETLRADAICVVDTGNCAVGVPTLTTSLRGMVAVDIRLDALGSVMHSGMFGGPAPDPVAGLIQVLASLHDEHGDTTVDGVGHGQAWAGARYPAEQFRKDARCSTVSTSPARGRCPTCSGPALPRRLSASTFPTSWTPHRPSPPPAARGSACGSPAERQAGLRSRSCPSICVAGRSSWSTTPPDPDH